MKTKSLLLGSAAALFAVTGARAADAVIIPEPEMVEYVRVCDAAGTGYFYIPGTETCLKIGGYVRFQINADTDPLVDELPYEDSTGYVDFDTKVSLQVSSWTDSEIGPIATFYELVQTAYDESGLSIDSAYISFAGLKMGYFGGFLDNGINGETDSNGLSNKFNTIQYTGTAGALSFGLAIDELDHDEIAVWTHEDGVQFGVSGMLGYTVGGVAATLSGAYDTLAEEWVLVARASAEVGMGTLQGRFTWASGFSAYNDTTIDGSPMDWVAEASYAAKVNDKLTLTPGFSYAHSDGGDNFWRAGLTADYTIAANLAAKLSVQYEDFNDDWSGPGDDSYNGFNGFLRFQASF